MEASAANNPSNPTPVLVVLSGGQDSTTCLFEARRKYGKVHCLTFDYGQTHRRELQASATIAHLADVASHRIIRVGPILSGTSPLTNQAMQLEQYQSFESMESIIGDRVEKTFVPMRNALFLTIAANYAVHIGCKIICTGVCEADNANYPDCRHSFIRAQEACIREALGDSGIHISTPLIYTSKEDSVRLSLKNGAYYPLAFSHTAYDGQFPPLGKDHASVLRAHGFEVAGFPDPLFLRAVCEMLIEDKRLPKTENYRGNVWETCLDEYKDWISTPKVSACISKADDAMRGYRTVGQWNDAPTYSVIEDFSDDEPPL